MARKKQSFVLLYVGCKIQIFDAQCLVLLCCARTTPEQLRSDHVISATFRFSYGPAS